MKRSQHGFALVAAIVMVVVLAALAGFVASMVGGQSATQQLERMSQVVEGAAQTGVEWGAYRVLRPVAAPACPPATSLALPGGLSMVTVRVTCNRVNTTENGSPVSVYRIDATATYGVLNSPDYVERVKTAVFSR